MTPIKILEHYLHTPALQRSLSLPSDAVLPLSPLGQGEYNANYCFSHPITGKKYVLRINTGSQMHLSDQIGYEYHALQLLEPSGRTPKGFYVDNSCATLPYGVLVMEYLPGAPLDYAADLPLAAGILADIHRLPIQPHCTLIAPERPLAAMLEECRAMAEVYLQWPNRSHGVARRLQSLLTELSKRLGAHPSFSAPPSIINTELNSGNFLINGPGRPNYLVDWEKPLLADPAQDLGHFLAPTTTFWKTDHILTSADMREFLDTYLAAAEDAGDRSGLSERLPAYLTMTCLRGVTWCAMAYVEYQRPDRVLQNSFTYEKIKAYLAPDFLDRIYADYIARDFLS